MISWSSDELRVYRAASDLSLEPIRENLSRLKRAVFDLRDAELDARARAIADGFQEKWSDYEADIIAAAKELALNTTAMNLRRLFMAIEGCTEKYNVADTSEACA